MNDLTKLADKAQDLLDREGDIDDRNMEWYVVGGAVRDVLLGKEPNDLDFVVVDETPESMLDRGFKLIDNENNNTFPVFITPAEDEFALARMERDSGDGYKGFDVDVDDVTLEEDLERRDLTINAMAVSKDGDLIDPHNGLQDLEDGIIRHVSDAFREDPLRVLRVARFAARLDFDVAEETKVIMWELRRDIDSLPGERLRMELVKSFKQAESPRKFFDVLLETGALMSTFPNIRQLRHVPAGPPEHHEEGNAYEHTMRVLEEMKRIRGNDEKALLMALVHDIGKVMTPVDKLPNHHGHGDDGLEIIDYMNNRLKFSNEQLKAMKEASKHHMRLKNVEEMRDATLFDTYNQLHNPMRMVDLMVADGRGKEPQKEFPAMELIDAFSRAKIAINNIGGDDLIEDGYDPDEIGGMKFGKLLRDRRIERMHSLS